MKLNIFTLSEYGNISTFLRPMEKNYGTGIRIRLKIFGVKECVKFSILLAHMGYQ